MKAPSLRTAPAAPAWWLPKASVPPTPPASYSRLESVNQQGPRPQPFQPLGLVAQLSTQKRVRGSPALSFLAHSRMHHFFRRSDAAPPSYMSRCFTTGTSSSSTSCSMALLRLCTLTYCATRSRCSCQPSTSGASASAARAPSSAATRGSPRPTRQSASWTSIKAPSSESRHSLGPPLCSRGEKAIYHIRHRARHASVSPATVPPAQSSPCVHRQRTRE